MSDPNGTRHKFADIFEGKRRPNIAELEEIIADKSLEAQLLPNGEVVINDRIAALPGAGDEMSDTSNWYSSIIRANEHIESLESELAAARAELAACRQELAEARRYNQQLSEHLASKVCDTVNEAQWDALWQIAYPDQKNWEYPAQVVRHLRDFFDKLKAESAAQLAELNAIADALGTYDGHSSVSHIEKLKAELERVTLRWQTGTPPTDGWYWIQLFTSVAIGRYSGYNKAFSIGTDWVQCKSWAGPIPEPQETK